MPLDLDIVTCDPPIVPVAQSVCRNINKGAYYVTSQPIYGPTGTNPYQLIHQAGILNVLCVRDPLEVSVQPTPFDLTEVSQLITNGVAITMVPLPHINMTQAQFNQQAFKAATVIHQWTTSDLPGLIHCSSGDRASCAFGAFLATYGGYTSPQASQIAQHELVLQNTQFIAWLNAYQKPT